MNWAGVSKELEANSCCFDAALTGEWSNVRGAARVLDTPVSELGHTSM